MAVKLKFTLPLHANIVPPIRPLIPPHAHRSPRCVCEISIRLTTRLTARRSYWRHLERTGIARAGKQFSQKKKMPARNSLRATSR